MIQCWFCNSWVDWCPLMWSPISWENLISWEDVRKVEIGTLQYKSVFVDFAPVEYKFPLTTKEILHNEQFLLFDSVWKEDYGCEILELCYVYWNVDVSISRNSLVLVIIRVLCIYFIYTFALRLKGRGLHFYYLS